jgi:hypothetical protein
LAISSSALEAYESSTPSPSPEAVLAPTSPIESSPEPSVDDSEDSSTPSSPTPHDNFSRKRKILASSVDQEYQSPPSSSSSPSPTQQQIKQEKRKKRRKKLEESVQALKDRKKSLSGEVTHLLKAVEELEARRAELILVCTSLEQRFSPL